MDYRDAAREGIDFADFMIGKYTEGLSDEEIVHQPYPDFNPIALQLGHLIATAHRFLQQHDPSKCPSLPEGFQDRHSLKEGDRADRSRYLPLADYLELMSRHSAALKEMLSSMTDDELSKPGPMPGLTPTMGSVFPLFAAHTASHAGQFVAVRRSLGKPIAF